MIGTCLGALQRTFSLYRSQRVMPWHQSIASALNGSSQTALSISEQIWSETSSVGKDQMKQPPQPELLFCVNWYICSNAPLKMLVQFQLIEYMYKCMHFKDVSSS